ncbi:MAG: glutamate racemase [Phycisphaerae bacterium]
MMKHDTTSASSLPIAVFDSGLGGLTVVRALRALLPAETIAYFGDTARLPYGTKSAATVHRFTRQCLGFLMKLTPAPKLLVVACNTASALALEQLKGEFPVPVIGVLEPGATAAVELAGGGHSLRQIGLIATEATIASGAYPAAVARLDGQIHVVSRACPLLVPLIEEGREPDDPIVRLVLEEYLQPFKQLQVAALILGCTHYPILAPAIAKVLGAAGGGATLVDSAQQTALVVQRQLATMAALNAGGTPGKLTCYVTDQGQRFERLAGRFLGQPVSQPVWVTPEMLEANSGAT